MSSTIQRLLVPALVAACLLAAAAPAGAFRLGGAPAPVSGNPADRLADLPADPDEYDPATHCSTTVRPGMIALVGWLGRNARGAFWGTYRCEKWGPHVRVPARREPRRRLAPRRRRPRRRAAGRALIDLLLAPDRTGLPHALARRMGVEEIIWDCSYWGAGMDRVQALLGLLQQARRAARKHVDPTAGHRDHLHIGMSKAGAARRTSFWLAAGAAGA